MHKRAIYWFKRDLRINDNKSFFFASQNSQELIPIFIFIPELLDKFKSYDNRLGFVIESLNNLTNELQKLGSNLFCYNEEPKNVFNHLIEQYKPDAVFTNKAFSWSGKNIEEKVEILCKDKSIHFYSITDNFLCKLENIPYKKVYTYFYNHWKNNLDLSIIPTPKKILTPQLNEPKIKTIESKITYQKNRHWTLNLCLQKFESFDFSNYEHTRNKLDFDGTSKLSPYIRFGLISLRKLYKKVKEQAGEDCQFLKELAWREFWYHIKLNFANFNQLEFQEKGRKIKWKNEETLINAFVNAKTGYPLIDAAIKQLKEEGWMHNRARMIVASFLTKDLLVDWRIGEKFFMEHLLDYDEVVNVGNWQWSASVGPDPKPLRVFNPIIQAQKFDPEAKFIKKYLPELKNIDPAILHNPISNKLNYHTPIVNHYERLDLIRKTFLII